MLSSKATLKKNLIILWRIAVQVVTASVRLKSLQSV